MSLLRAYLRKYRKILMISIALATINQVFSLINPQIFQILIDQYATKIDILTQSEFVNGIIYWSLISVAAAAISRIAKTFQDYYVNLMAQKIGAKIYADGIEHTFSLPYAVFEDRKSGSLLDKLQKARQDIQKFLMSMINTVFLTAIGMLIVMVYAFWVSWIIWLVFLSMVPVLAWTTIYLSSRIRDAQKQIVKTSAELAWATIENVKNVTLIKSLWLEQQEVSHLNRVNDELIDLEIEKLKLVKSITFWQGTLIQFLRTFLQFIMLRLVFDGTITIGQFFTLLFYSFLLFNPLYQLPTVAANRQEVKASNEILDEIFKLPIIHTPDDAKQIQTIERIAFDGVTFGYNDEQTALNNVVFEAKQWETIAFVGPSGAGKSTILKLLTGLYQASQWAVCINDIKGSKIDRTYLKQHLSIVSQDTQLFSGTILENLQFVAPGATEQQAREVLDQAQLGEFVMQAPLGLDSTIGEWWLKLSGWQKQRLAIARALLRDPDLLIFDEATSSLDSLVEAKITQTIADISQDNHDLITVLVAHRLSTIMHADRIYVLEDGQVVEQGNHQKLVDEKGLYYALWRQQGGK